MMGADSPEMTHGCLDQSEMACLPWVLNIDHFNPGFLQVDSCSILFNHRFQRPAVSPGLLRVS